MEETAVRVVRVDEYTLQQVLSLIAEYQRFYGAEPDEERNAEHFGRLLREPTLGTQFVALGDQFEAVGFATVYYPMQSAHPGASCLLNDLYVAPAARRAGVGSALVERCREHAFDSGCEELWWQTERSNTTVQRLYDKLGAARSEWYTYALPVALHKENE